MSTVLPHPEKPLRQQPRPEERRRNPHEAMPVQPVWRSEAFFEDLPEPAPPQALPPNGLPKAQPAWA